MSSNIKINWIEVSMVVDGESAEAVADVFTRYVSGGVIIESTSISSDPNGEGVPTGPVRVCGYLPADSSLIINSLSEVKVKPSGCRCSLDSKEY